MANQLKDPVDKRTKDIQENKAEEEMRSFDISKLSLEDFKPLTQRDARSPHPFDGYPAKMVKVGEYLDPKDRRKTRDLMMPRYAVVALNPKEVVFQDPSGKNQSVRDGKTNDEKIVNIYAPHNRCVVDYENGGYNTDICFDRSITLSDGRVIDRVAFIPSHSARAQIMYKLDRTGERIQIDSRYLLLDVEQSSRLRRVFEMIVNPKIKNEHLARWVSGESEDVPEEILEE